MRDTVLETIHEQYPWMYFVFTLDMVDAAARMSLGDLDVQINIASKDEIGMLARSIGRMQTSLAYAMKRLKKT